MRRLLLLRHAKAVSSPGQPDRNRALSARGRAQAPLLGAFLAREKLIPDLALVSTSVRTRETFALVAPHLPHAVKSVFDDRLYHAEPETILDVVSDVRGSAASILVIGHNPGLHELAIELARPGDDKAYELENGFPTAALAAFSFDIETWAELPGARGTLEHVVTPAALGAGAD